MREGYWISGGGAGIGEESERQNSAVARPVEAESVRDGASIAVSGLGGG